MNWFISYLGVVKRVSDIIWLIDINDWNHVVKKKADLLSRGTSISSLCQSHLWWLGPDWLQQPILNWWFNKLNIEYDIPEQKFSSAILVSINDYIDFRHLLTKYSSLNKLLRILSYVFRFINNCRRTKQYAQQSVTPKEFDNSLMFLIKITQMESFPDEYNNLLQRKPINKK